MGESPITLGKLIKSARLEAGLTQDNLATRVGVTSRYIMAERVGFEPTVPLTGHLISSQAPSTTRTPLQFLLRYSIMLSQLIKRCQISLLLFPPFFEKTFHHITTFFRFNTSSNSYLMI